VQWIRPKHVLYKDKLGNIRRYYPDFYLPEYDIYLDPKNNYLITTDIFKIFQSAEYNKIKILILGERYLNFNSYKHMVNPDGNAPPYPTCKEGVLLLN